MEGVTKPTHPFDGFLVLWCDWDSGGTGAGGGAASASLRLVEHAHEGLLVLTDELQQRGVRLSDLLQYCVQQVWVLLHHGAHLLELWL